MKIYKISEIDLDNCKYLKPLITESETLVDIKYNDQNLGVVPFIFELPPLYAIDEIIPKISQYITHELLIPIICINNNVTDKVIKFLTNMDNVFMNDIKKHKNEWNIKGDMLSYNSIIKEIENPGVVFSNGALKIKFINSPTFKTVVINKYGKQVKLEDYNNIFNGNCYVQIILECVSVWYSNNKCGVYLKPHQILVEYNSPPNAILSTYSFVDDVHNKLTSETNLNTSVIFRLTK